MQLSLQFKQGVSAARRDFKWARHDAPIGWKLEVQDCDYKKGTPEFDAWHKAYREEWVRQNEKIARLICIPNFYGLGDSTRPERNPAMAERGKK